jgi:hypothetical protein
MKYTYSIESNDSVFAFIFDSVIAAQGFSKQLKNSIIEFHQHENIIAIPFISHRIH